MAEEIEQITPAQDSPPADDTKEQEAISSEEPTPRDTDPLLRDKVIERVHDFNPTGKVEASEEPTSLDDLFPPGDDKLTLPPPELPTQEGEAPTAPDLKKMQVSDDPPAIEDPLIETPPVINTPASDFVWQVFEHTVPNVVHEFARMDKGDVAKILSKANLECGEDETAVIEEINDDFKKGLKISDENNQMGKEVMRQLFVSKGIEKKITPELMLGIVFVMILISWGLAYKRFRRQKKDLFGKLEHLVKQQLQAQKTASEEDTSTKKD